MVGTEVKVLAQNHTVYKQQRQDPNPGLCAVFYDSPQAPSEPHTFIELLVLLLEKHRRDYTDCQSLIMSTIQKAKPHTSAFLSKQFLFGSWKGEKCVPELETDFSRHLKESNKNVLSLFERRNEKWRASTKAGDFSDQALEDSQKMIQTLITVVTCTSCAVPHTYQYLININNIYSLL